MIKLELSIEKVNQILAALGKQPFETVFQLINEISTTAQNQLSKENELKIVDKNE
jgi:hypothetical protein